MFRCLCILLARRKTEPDCAPRSQPPAGSAGYRLVGYATTPEGTRLRLYIDAQAAVTPATPVFAQTTPGRFDYTGQPLALRIASDELAQSMRARMLGQKRDDDPGSIQFQPAA